jgi:hypothetical protein
VNLPELLKILSIFVSISQLKADFKKITVNLQNAILQFGGKRLTIRAIAVKLLASEQSRFGWCPPHPATTGAYGSIKPFEAFGFLCVFYAAAGASAFTFWGPAPPLMLGGVLI